MFKLLTATTAAVVAAGVVATCPVAAHADACADTDLVFARGTGEPAGLGWLGDMFANDLRGDLGGHSLSVYAVNYPATYEWSTGVEGIADAKAHIMSVAAQCPRTKMVLSGYSQGAAIMGFVTSPAVPAGVDPATVPAPMPPEIANHVSAVVLFGTPNERAMRLLGEPPIAVGPAYLSKTLMLCANDDPVCSTGLNLSAHKSYGVNGMVAQGAQYAASRWNN